MKRKVIQQGESTLMVSLPREWAKKFGVRKGDELEINERGRELVVATSAVDREKKTEVDVTDISPMIPHTISALYRAGYDEVKLTYANPQIVHEVQGSLGKTVSGFEIIEQGRNGCTIRNIEGELQEGFDPILRRAFVILLSMVEDCYKAFDGQDYKGLASIALLDESINRFTTFCRRSLSKQGYKQPDKIQFIYFIVEQLESQASHLKVVCDTFANEKSYKMSKEVRETFTKTVKFMRLYYELFFSFDNKKLRQLGEMKTEIRKIATGCLNAEGRKGSVVLHNLVSIVDLTMGMIGPTIALAL